MRTKTGDETYADMHDDIAQALFGKETCSERAPHNSRDQRRKYAHYIPDFVVDGSVAGFT